VNYSMGPSESLRPLRGHISQDTDRTQQHPNSLTAVNASHPTDEPSEKRHLQATLPHTRSDGPSRYPGPPLPDTGMPRTPRN
jgi:hypothetical protein